VKKKSDLFLVSHKQFSDWMTRKKNIFFCSISQQTTQQHQKKLSPPPPFFCYKAFFLVARNMGDNTNNLLNWSANMVPEAVTATTKTSTTAAKRGHAAVQQDELDGPTLGVAVIPTRGNIQLTRASKNAAVEESPFASHITNAISWMLQNGAPGQPMEHAIPDLGGMVFHMMTEALGKMPLDHTYSALGHIAAKTPGVFADFWIAQSGSKYLTAANVSTVLRTLATSLGNFSEYQENLISALKPSNLQLFMTCCDALGLSTALNLVIKMVGPCIEYSKEMDLKTLTDKLHASQLSSQSIEEFWVTLTKQRHVSAQILTLMALTIAQQRSSTFISDLRPYLHIMALLEKRIQLEKPEPPTSANHLRLSEEFIALTKQSIGLESIPVDTLVADLSNLHGGEAQLKHAIVQRCEAEKFKKMLMLLPVNDLVSNLPKEDILDIYRIILPAIGGATTTASTDFVEDMLQETWNTKEEGEMTEDASVVTPAKPHVTETPKSSIRRRGEKTTEIAEKEITPSPTSSAKATTAKSNRMLLVGVK
jgi:hypothetical protein